MQKATCTRIDKIQSDLISKTLKLYENKKYREFWDAVASLDIFLSVKEGLGCPIKKPKK